MLRPWRRKPLVSATIILTLAVAAVAAARAFSSLLFEVQPWDPRTLAATALALAAIASAAPAIRAPRINPSDAMHAG